MTDDTAKRAREEAERLLPCECRHSGVGIKRGWHLVGCPGNHWTAVAAYIEGLMKRIAFLTNGEAEKQMAQALGVDDERTTWTMVGLQQIARHRQQQLADAQREIERLKASKPWLHRWEDTKERRALMDENAALRHDIEELNQEVLDERALTQKIAEGLDPDKGGDEPYRLLVEIEKQNAALREENERLKNLDYLGAHKDALAIAQREISVLRGKASFWECREDETSANLTKMREKYADAQREIERLKAAAWATLTIADMTVPQIVAMKQENAALRSEVEAWRAAKDQHVSDLREMDEENAALRRALAEAKQAIADFLAGEDEAIVHLKEMGVVKLHEQFPLVDALRRALAGKEE